MDAGLGAYILVFSHASVVDYVEEDAQLGQADHNAAVVLERRVERCVHEAVQQERQARAHGH